VDAVYLNDWKCKEDMVSDFEDIHLSGKEYHAEQAPYPNVQGWLAKKEKMKAALASDKYNVNVLLASYGYANYSCDAYVLFERDGKLYEVHGGHCSCYGLEDQWEPEEVTVESIVHRLRDGKLGTDNYSDNKFAFELGQVVAELAKSPAQALDGSGQ
jgi:hypothetical protein